MKKTLITLAALLLLTGCGNNSGTKTCTTTTTDDDGYKTTDTMVITYKDSKVTQVEDTKVSEMNPSYIDFTVALSEGVAKEMNKWDGFEVKYSKEGGNKIKGYINVDFTKIDANAFKEALGELGEENDMFYTNNDITIDDFISKYADGYTCK